jgi:hypothetical protein
VDLKAMDERLLILFICVGFDGLTHGSGHGSVVSSCEDGNERLEPIKGCEVLKKNSDFFGVNYR